MNTLRWKFESEILSKYGRVVRRLILIPPDWIERKLNGEVVAHKVPPIVKVFFLLVIGLSLASISNIGIRAYHYHANLFSYITGACFALVVPASVYVAAHMKGLTPTGRRYTWAVAAFAALLSSFIQVKLYMNESDVMLSTWLSGNIDIEALSFSAGIPFFEVLIASLAAMISDAHDRATVEADVQQAEKDRLAKIESDAEAKRMRVEEEERAEREHRRYMEQQRQAAELEAYRAKLAQDAEIERQRAMVEMRIKEQKALARTTGKPATEKTNGNGKPNGSKLDPGMESEYELMKRMITIYQREPTASNRKVGDEIGVSHTTVSDLLSNLASKEVVHVEKVGRGKSVTVNGKLSAFLAGEI